MRFLVENWHKNVISSKNYFEVWVSVTFVTSRLQTLLTTSVQLKNIYGVHFSVWSLRPATTSVP